MGCSAFSGVSMVPPTGQHGNYGSGGSTFGNDPVFERSAFDFQNTEEAEGQQGTGQYAYDYDYAFASTDQQPSDAEANTSFFDNSWFTDSAPGNSSSGNYAYDSDYQYARSGF